MNLNISRHIINLVGRFGRKCIEWEYLWYAGRYNKEMDKLISMATRKVTRKKQSATSANVRRWQELCLAEIKKEYPHATTEEPTPVSIVPPTAADTAFAMDNISPPKTKVK